jgi:phospholipase C
MLFAAACCLGGCGWGDNTPPPGLVVQPNGQCSDITAAITRWQNQGAAPCADPPFEFRTMTSMGNGFLLGWAVNGNIDLWSMKADASFGTGPIDVDVLNVHNSVVAGLGPDRLIEYDQQIGTVNVWAPDLTARGTAEIFAARITQKTWTPAFDGRDLVSLDDSHLLDFRPSTGAYTVVQYDRGQELNDPFIQVGGAGKKEEFRRGHRLVALTANRLLEWVPSTHDYRVWGFDYGRLPGDVFDAAPVSSGSASLSEENEILVVSPDKIAIWDRTKKTLETRTFDPLSADPLAGTSLNVTHHDRLRSLLPGAAQPTSSPLMRRLLLVYQHGRSFDAFFGRYCQAPTGSAPSCHDGAGCCEQVPATIQAGVPFRSLDALDDGYVPNESFDCMVQKIDDGAMDRFVGSSLAGCGDPRDFACAGAGTDAGPIATYQRLASAGTLADHYFPSIAPGLGAAALNAVILATALPGMSLEGQNGRNTITELLALAHVPWAFYFTDPTKDTMMYPEPIYYDGRWSHFRYIDELVHDLSMQQLPQISVVIPTDGADGEPGTPLSLASGAALVGDITTAVAQSGYAAETLVVVAYISSGGFFDHVAPPAPPPASVEPQMIPYGPRTPFLTLGPFARRNHVSHAQLEPSSVTAFMEWNWLGARTGQLGGRDRFVNNLGSVLDPAATGVTVP